MEPRFESNLEFYPKAESQDVLGAEIISNTQEFINPQEVMLHREEHAPTPSSDCIGAKYLDVLSRMETWKRLGAPNQAIEIDTNLAAIRLSQARDVIRDASHSSVAQKLFESSLSQIPVELSNFFSSSSDKTPLDKLAETDNETLSDFLVWNKNRLDKLNEELAPTIEVWKQEFKDRLDYAIERQNLPLSEEQLKDRMSNIEVFITDPISMHLEVMGGYYDATDGVIKVSANENMDLMRKVLFHEFMHHISGQTAVREITKWSDEEISETVGYRISRSGIAGDFGHGSEWWFDEAVTEQLTELMLNENAKDIDFASVTHEQFFSTLQTHGGYQSERAILFNLIEPEGYDIHNMISAYFEDYLTDDKPPIPNTTKMWENLRDIYGKSLEETIFVSSSVPFLNKDYAKRIITNIRLIRMLKTIGLSRPLEK